MLQPSQYFFSPIAYDFAEPDTAVDRNEERAFTDSGRLRVGDDIRVEQIIPNFYDFSLRAAPIHAQTAQDFRHQSAHRLGSQRMGLL